MLNLIFAPSADVLVPLAESEIRRAWGDPFDPPAIIVPNPAVAKWLTVQLAKSSFGCVANANMPLLEKFLWNALGDEAAGMKMLGGDLMAQVICALLDGGILGDDTFSPLRDYLVDRDSGRIDTLKRVQLSARIAQQFLEYEYNRPSVWDEGRAAWKMGIDAKWLAGRGRRYFDEQEHEAWQMELYRKVYECFDNDKSTNYTTLPHLYRRRREECAKAGRPWCDVGSNKRIFLFGVSKISHFHRNTLVEISQMDGVEMHVFLTNPCAEFWEDVDTSRRPKRRWNSRSTSEEAGITPVKPEDYDKEELDRFEQDNVLLKLWGGAGKENIFLWCPQAEWNFEYHGDEIVGDTLLASIQKTLLSRANSLGAVSDNIMNDRSLQILACPDAGREVEELRELILDMAHEKTINSFADIAVYMPDTSKYLPHIQRVFGAYPLHHPEHIPFSILGASCGSSLVARGLFALLGIVSGEFNRARVFELLRNPIVQASRKISPSSVEVWERMAETFGIFRGYDAEQRRSMGDVGEAVTDEHTFTRGIARINEEADVAGSGVILRDNKLSAVFRPDTAASVAKVSAERFLSLLTELNDLSKQFTKSIHTSANVEGGLGRSSLQNINKSCIISIRESIEAIRKAVWSWLGVITEDVGDSIAEARVRREALEGIELIKLQSTLAGREGMERDEFIALVRGCVPEELEVPSSAWHGITFAPLRSSMVLPHRAIFVLGLDATAFPGTSEPGGWNLLSRNRIVGDSDKVRDNRFAFLELLHAAKERLVLSFRARDMQKDELLQPSSVVLELEEYLKNQRIINKDSNDKNFGECLVRREIPWVVHESLDAAKKYGRGHGTWDKAQRELADIAAESAGKRAEHRHKLAPPSTKRAPLTTDEDGGATNLYDLKKFFENPIEYHLARTLGIRGDDDTGDMMAADEPVSTEKIFSSKLRRQVWITVLNLIFSDDCTDTDSLVTEAVDEADRIYDEHIDSGQAPEGHIRRMEKRELLEWTKKCVEAANALRGHFPYHTLTEKSEFSFTCSGFTVTGEFALTLVPKNPNDKSQKTGILAFDKYDAPGDSPGLWLDGMALWRHQAQNGDPRPIALVALNHGDTPEAKLSTMKMNWENGQLDEIEKWLAGLLTQMLTNNACEHLPFRVIADIIKPKKKDGEVGFEERMKKLTTQALKDNLLGDKYSTFTEAFDLTDATPPELDDAALQKLLESRYAPILGRWIHE